jgi:ribosome-binding factor A
MSTRRTVRVSEAVRMELANLFTRERSLEGIIITISSVDVTPDLKNAHIFLSVLEHALSQESILALLNKKRYEWQGTIAHRLQLKYTPRLIFKFDSSLERGDRVMQILNELDLNAPPVKTPPESEE